MISVQQYHAYCQESNQSHSIKAANIRTITEIGGISKSVGVVIIQVPFAKLSAVIDVSCPELAQNIRNLLSIKAVLENDLDISIQGSYIRLGNRRHQLITEIVFLIHRWPPSDVPFTFSTKQGLQIFH